MHNQLTPETTFESPFANSYEPAPVAPALTNGAGSFSPFVSEVSAEVEGEYGAPADVVGEIMAEIHEPELDEAVEALAVEAGELVQPRDHDETEAGDSRELVLGEYFAPLVRSAEAFIDRAAGAMGSRDAFSADEAELHELIDEAAGETPDGPAFELFFGALKKKLKKVASKAVSLAKKGVQLAGGALIGQLLGKLKPLVRPLIDKVVKIALDKIPAPYRPLAQMLARKLGAKLGGPARQVLASAGRSNGAAHLGAVAAPAMDAAAQSADTAAAVDGAANGAASVADAPTADAAPEPPEAGVAPEPTEPAVPDAAQAQQDLDAELAERLVRDDAGEYELIGSGPAFAPSAARDPFGELDRARARLQRELGELDDGGDAGPAIERFAPAVLFAVRTGIKLIGRPKVVNFLGGLIAKLIAPLIGKQGAPGLGRALADLGLRTLLQAEVEPLDESEAAQQVIASTVEETIRRVAALPEEMLDDPQAFELHAYEAFQDAAAANFPPHLVRQELRESEAPGAWLRMPLRRRQHHYKKYSRVFPVTISPQVASAVRGFGGSTLGSFFRDRLRLPPGNVRAKVHLFEATPRTRLAKIARSEGTRGLGSSERDVWSQIHPLTTEAAGLLLGAPKLGRPLAEAAEPEIPSIGQRYYYLEVAEAPIRPVGRESHMHVSLDLDKDEVRVCAYLSEPLAQKLATGLRKQASAAILVAELRAALAHASSAVVAQRSRSLVRVIGQRGPRPATPMARGVRRAVRRALGAQAIRWVWSQLPAQLATHGQEIIQKTEGPEDGVRLVFTFHTASGLRPFSQALRGVGTPQQPSVRPTRWQLAVEPGYRNGC